MNLRDFSLAWQTPFGTSKYNFISDHVVRIEQDQPTIQKK